ncbi:MAG: Rne/Rng family ribonuclease [Ignavibacteria bacterium]|nr:Rne/Rng family ribonuclease [Ignavibacteria bacterium]MBK7444949.1 Rne/Rng family ribonuclease [Ignavibacteria bacterium]MBK9403338.1 Rne/Rng family ribonuclease [Ignavibacteria bacterium]MBL0107491.1 Rne/Rng family ribonuclease [Ignavibacteria bacterium]
MKKVILINSIAEDIRIAITEDGKLAEFFLDTPDKERNVGDIYLGKVGKVIPGIRAAFIDLGFQQDAFLHFSDIGNTLDDYSAIIGDDSDIEEDEEEEDEPQTNFISQKDSYHKLPNLERGQDIVVQITKEPVGNKGFRVTSKVSIPGRYLVLIPFEKKIGLSKKIYNPKEKRRLRSIVKSTLPKGFGIIIRTVAAGQEDNLILDDLNTLIQTWNDIQSKLKTIKAPLILHKDVSTTSSVIRDLFKEDISKIIVDSKKIFKDIKLYVDETSPEFSSKLELYNGDQPLFDVYNIEKQIEESIQRKVWLKNGGYIIIEPTEAMTVVDVNSGKYARHRDQEINSLNTNLESAKEIVRQIRLRDIGGIIVIDFIDLYDEKNRRRLFEDIKREFKNDRAKSTILPVSEFGLVEITRQRIRQNIIHTVSDFCPMCNGSGHIQSKSTFLNRIERWITRYKGGNNGMSLTLTVNPYIRHYLSEGFISKFTQLRFKYFLFIKLEEDEKLSLNEFKFYSKKLGKDITAEFDN